jgi:shikimate dehydrogenase
MVALAPGVVRAGHVDEVAVAEVIVNATPVGMLGVTTDSESGAYPFDPSRLGPGQVVVDLVYDPIRTPLLQTAGERGAVTVNGVGMLTHQAAAAFRLWTRIEAPLAAMKVAMLAELDARRSASAL